MSDHALAIIIYNYQHNDLHDFFINGNYGLIKSRAIIDIRSELDMSNDIHRNDANEIYQLLTVHQDMDLDQILSSVASISLSTKKVMYDVLYRLDVNYQLSEDERQHTHILHRHLFILFSYKFNDIVNDKKITDILNKLSTDYYLTNIVTFDRGIQRLIPNELTSQLLNLLYNLNK
jgi:hypothetical protein